MRAIIVLRKPAGKARAGWGEASKRIAQAGKDEPAWPEFSNEGDRDTRW